MENKTSETFFTFDDSLPIVSFIKKDEPACSNGWVKVERYKVTIIKERLEESDDEIIERLINLYQNEENHHNQSAIDNYSLKRFGFRIYDKLNDVEQKDGE